jgi:hypothetical protein
VVITAGNNSVLDVQMGIPPPPNPDFSCFFVGMPAKALGQPVGVVFAGTQLVVQTRNPSGLQLGLFGPMTRFPVQPQADLGHELFHREAPAGLACASCHPEGRDDGRVWKFLPDGARRTQNLAGGVIETAPFHWDGALPSIHSLVTRCWCGAWGRRRRVRSRPRTWSRGSTSFPSRRRGTGSMRRPVGSGEARIGKKQPSTSARAGSQVRRAGAVWPGERKGVALTR